MVWFGEVASTIVDSMGTKPHEEIQSQSRDIYGSISFDVATLKFCVPVGATGDIVHHAICVVGPRGCAWHAIQRHVHRPIWKNLEQSGWGTADIDDCSRCAWWCERRL